IFEFHIYTHGVLLRNALLSSLCQRSKSFLVIDSHLSQHLSVDVDVSNLKSVHELAVGKSVHSCSSVDTCDPQLTHLALALFSACICRCECSHDRLFCNSVLFGAGSSVSFRQF